MCVCWLLSCRFVSHVLSDQVAMQRQTNKPRRQQQKQQLAQQHWQQHCTKMLSINVQEDNKLHRKKKETEERARENWRQRQRPAECHWVRFKAVYLWFSLPLSLSVSSLSCALCMPWHKLNAWHDAFSSLTISYSTSLIHLLNQFSFLRNFLPQGKLFSASRNFPAWNTIEIQNRF